jgi:phosphinothricin acetyltransferase
LYVALCEILKAQGYYNAYAGITLPNPASVGLHEALGFQPVGVYRSVGYKKGAWHDVGWWQKVLLEMVTDPPPPRSVVELEEASWAGLLAEGLAMVRERG